ncbi:MAG: SRPBCC family protein [Sphingomonas sp.]
MTIAPVVQSVVVKVPPPRAFTLFTADIARWWAPNMNIAKGLFADLVLEPRPGGRWFERSEDGAETDWGKVLAWDPPGRLVIGWQLNAEFKFDPDFVTEVEVTFEPEGQGTRVTLEHRNLERFGPSAEIVAGKVGGGWPRLLQLFADFTQKEDQ